MVHIRFCMQLYQMQVDGGRYFIHEHAAAASSWAEPEVRRIMQLDGVQVATGDQCQYNATDRDGDPIKKLSAGAAPGNLAGVLEDVVMRCAMVSAPRMLQYILLSYAGRYSRAFATR